MPCFREPFAPLQHVQASPCTCWPVAPILTSFGPGTVAFSRLVGPDDIRNDQPTDRAVGDHLGTPSAQHEVATGIEDHVNVLGFIRFFSKVSRRFQWSSGVVVTDLAQIFIPPLTSITVKGNVELQALGFKAFARSFRSWAPQISVSYGFQHILKAFGVCRRLPATHWPLLVTRRCNMTREE